MANESAFGGDTLSTRWASALVGGGVGCALATGSTAAFHFLTWSVPFWVVLTVLILPGVGVGGAVAGYLRGSEQREGVLVGGLAGVISTIPGLVFVSTPLLHSGVELISHFADQSYTAGLLIAVVVAIAAVIIASVAVAIVTIAAVISAIGGAIGAAVSDSRPPK